MFLITFFISQFYIHFFDIYEFHFSITDGFLTLFGGFHFRLRFLLFLTEFSSIVHQSSDPLKPQKSVWRLHENTIFTFSTLFFRGHFSTPKMIPKLTLKQSQNNFKSTIFTSFVAPGQFPAPPRAILDALRSLQELFRTSLKL